MKSKLLTATAALALLAGIGAASAQSGMQQERGPNTAPSQSQGGPDGPAQQTQDRRPSQDERRTQSPQTQGEGGKSQAENPGDRATPGSAQRQLPEKKEVVQGKSGDPATRPGGDKSAAQLNDDQRTKIGKTIKTQNVKRVTNVNFNVSVGTVVPGTVAFYPLPSNVVAVVPAYRGYLYFVVGDEIVIVHPRTRAIVAVIPA